MCEHNKRAEEGRYCAYCEVERLNKAIQRVHELIKEERSIAMVEGEMTGDNISQATRIRLVLFEQVEQALNGEQ